MTITKNNYRDDSWSIGRGFLRLNRHGEGDGRYCMGEYESPDGTVTIYRQSDHTRIDFNFGGRIHSRTWDREWGDRTLPGLCRDLIRDIHDTVTA